MNQKMSSLGHQDKIAVLIRPAVFQRHFMVTAYVVGHEFRAGNGAPTILSRKQGDSVVCKLNSFYFGKIRNLLVSLCYQSFFTNYF